jgi:hypothetical protein
MSKIKSFKSILEKKKTFRREAVVPLDEEFSLPLRSLSAYQKNKASLIKTVRPPSKTRKMTEQEREEFAKNNPNISEVMIKSYVVAYLDETDEEYIANKQKYDVVNALLGYSVYVDLKHKVNKETELWEDLGLQNDEDYIGLTNLLFNELELGEDFLKKMIVAINALEGDPLYAKLAKLENLYKDKSILDLMDIIADVAGKEQAKK